MPDWQSGTNVRFSKEAKAAMNTKADKVLGGYSSRLIGAGAGGNSTVAGAAA